jgi:hypothetical protein
MFKYFTPTPKGLYLRRGIALLRVSRKGPARARRASIIGGLVIPWPNDEGRGWYKEKYGYELSDAQSQGVNITIRLRKLLDAKELALDSSPCKPCPLRL